MNTLIDCSNSKAGNVGLIRMLNVSTIHGENVNMECLFPTLNFDLAAAATSPYSVLKIFYAFCLARFIPPPPMLDDRFVWVG